MSLMIIAIALILLTDLVIFIVFIAQIALSRLTFHANIYLAFSRNSTSNFVGI